MVIDSLHQWFQKNRRVFPWRERKTPYKVWISEVMLQQTRASVVVPYFNRWMRLFPDIKTLAKASSEEIIKAWEGLGYYSRARNLHKAAKQILEFHQGKLPECEKALSEIQGIGPYTKGAILSFGFYQRAVAVDGNVLRVISRFCLIEENIKTIRAKRKICEETEKLLDEKMPWVTMEALIELGATICSLKPRCEDCPIKKKCLAFSKGKQEALPIKDPEKKPIDLKRSVFIIMAKGKVLLKKGESGKVMADLYEFPYFEIKELDGKRGEVKKQIENFEKEYNLKLFWEKSLSPVQHTFTRYRSELFPEVFTSEETPPIKGLEWVELEKIKELPFSAGHRKLFKTIKEGK